MIAATSIKFSFPDEMPSGTSSTASNYSSKRYGCFGYQRIHGPNLMQSARYRTYALRYTAVALRTVGLILLYYSFSIGITFYQKWFIKVTFTVFLHLSSAMLWVRTSIGLD